MILEKVKTLNRWFSIYFIKSFQGEKKGLNENQIFDVDQFYFEVMDDVKQTNKQEKFRIVFKALNTFVRNSSEFDDSQTLANGLRYLLALFNDKPVGGFTDKKPTVGKNDEEYISILGQEFKSN